MRYYLTLLLSLCLTYAFSQETRSIINGYFNEHHRKHQLDEEDVSEFSINDQYDSESLNGKHVYIQQTVQGYPVFNAIASVLIKNGKVEVFNSSFIKDINEKVSSSDGLPMDVTMAVDAAFDHLNLDPTTPTSIIESNESGYHYLSNTGISKRKIKAKLIYQPVDERKVLRFAWEVTIKPKDSNNWWNVALDAANGELLRKHNWMLTCTHEQKVSTGIDITTDGQHMSYIKGTASFMNASYRVYPSPVESPNHGNRSMIVDPADPSSSPYGWHDLDGVSGPETTITAGNNVLAREDRDGNNTGGYSPDGGPNLQFDFPLDFSQPPEINQDAAITNLFYWNNIMHDIFANYGFDEVSGNFQDINYSGNGQGGDFVVADAQDGSGINNANFGTPPEGSNPQMQMFLWSAPGGPSDNFFINSPASSAASFLGIPAAFGPSIPVTPITADLALVQDDNASSSTNAIDGCDNITNASGLNGKIAVIERGECTFVSKIEKAQIAGAVAVIMINNEPGNPITMGGDSNTITIPSIMLSQSEGSSILSELQNGSSLNATLVNNGPYNVDGDFDNGIIAHEYGHGISSRLTGGADQSDCLFNAEQMGEGWSDWLGLVVTMRPDDQPEDTRGYATYAISQPTDGNGIRPTPYSTDMSINTATYGITNNNNTISQPHGIGYVWASMLWDLTWALVDEYGFDPDLYNGTGGNNMAIQLVLDGMKLQSCNPGFIDGRDAILQADQILNNGANACLIWEVFANRGLGFSADQGSPLDRSDQVEAFDLPVECNLSVNDIKSSQFNIYPNPADRIVNIQFSGSTVSDAQIAIYSLEGRSMMQENIDKIDDSQIQTGNLANGIYILKITVQNRSFTKKLIIR
jgi:hypothetical protein